jgi:hypothetical protein
MIRILRCLCTAGLLNASVALAANAANAAPDPDSNLPPMASAGGACCPPLPGVGVGPTNRSKGKLANLRLFPIRRIVLRGAAEVRRAGGFRNLTGVRVALWRDFGRYAAAAIRGSLVRGERGAQTLERPR